jgi:hypothetical protein
MMSFISIFCLTQIIFENFKIFTRCSINRGVFIVEDYFKNIQRSNKQIMYFIENINAFLSSDIEIKGNDHRI